MEVQGFGAPDRGFKVSSMKFRVWDSAVRGALKQNLRMASGSASRCEEIARSESTRQDSLKNRYLCEMPRKFRAYWLRGCAFNVSMDPKPPNP